MTEPRERTTPIRGVLLALTALGILGTGAELILLEHHDELRQWIPLVLLGVGLPVVLAAWARPGRGTLLTLRVVMAAYVVAACLGLYFHYTSNVLFEREMDASLGGVVLFWKAMRGATPALAPGALAHLGLLGLLAGWRHPALDREG